MRARAVSLALLLTALAAAAPPQPVITPYGANSFRVQWAPPGLPVVNSSYSPFLDAPVSSTPSSTAGNVHVNGNLRVTADAATGLIFATRVHDGAVVFNATALVFGQPRAGGRLPSAQLDAAGVGAGETLVGGGQLGLTGRATLALPFEADYVASEYYRINSGRTALLPLFFSSAGYGVMVAQQGYGNLRVDRAPNTSAFNAYSTATVELWITTVPAPAAAPAAAAPAAAAVHAVVPLLRQYADAVGHAPPMPAFAAGFIASKDRYRNQSQLLDVAHGYVDRGIPLSVLVIDWFHWANLGDMSLDPRCWPDPAGMVDELRGLGVELMTTHWPFMSPSSVHRAAFEAAGALAVNVSSGAADTFWQYLQNGSLITTLSPATANLTAAAWWAGYGRFGVRAMWLDETEPDRTAAANEGLDRGAWRYEGAAAVEVGPTWRQQWLRTMTGVLADAHGYGNFFLLSRSAWLGTAKYGHSLWSGDTDSSWDGLAAQVPTMLGAGLSGIGLWTSDLGGYKPTMQPFDASLEELLVRWAQFASVSPLMRLHGHRNGGPPADDVCMQTNGFNEPWTLFAQNTTASVARADAFVAAIRWREQLRNYVLDAQAAWAATGAPMAAPVWLAFPADAACAPPADGSGDGACGDAFVLGDSWLAKPVTTYQQQSAWAWLPRLPAGEYWTYAFGAQTAYGQGPVNVTVATPIDEFPLFYVNRAR
jgi:alpha-D-xyloside xylohydrolase